MLQERGTAALSRELLGFCPCSTSRAHSTSSTGKSSAQGPRASPGAAWAALQFGKERFGHRRCRWIERLSSSQPRASDAWQMSPLQV